MAIQRVTSVDLHLDLDPSGSRREALARALRDAVRSGRLEPGVALPSYRALALDLGIARNTVAETYAELVDEGWLTARQGSSTRVAHRARPTPVAGAAMPPQPRPLFDLRPGRPDPSSFPRSVWLASARRAINDAPSDAFGPGDPRGRIELRTALSDYLARTRGVRTDPQRIVVCSGFSQALTMLNDIVPAGPVALESFGLPFHRSIVEKSRSTVALGVDDKGCVAEDLGAGAASVAVLTPSHQFPTGVALAPERRTAAVQWARDVDGTVIEDDYDGEFRYDRSPIGAMQGLDPDRVMYVGSVSKSLSPAVRIGWMVVPDRLLDAVVAAKGVRESTVATGDQLTLADMLVSGRYDRHVRTMRMRYRARRNLLQQSMDRADADVRIGGIAAGLQAVITLPPGREIDALNRAAGIGLAIEGLSTFRHPAATDATYDGLVVGYSAPTENAYPAALEALMSVLS
ncbi:PLP-dependent aminotransferase family protein [Rhodococcus sp. 077-4]|uniref:MocR-like pyridoxine biosynthesis transcription factor PdxR n=1 Tax=Rhodococcus sp. 077-4 TaxID=2789271 RepID=UPI0039F60BFC